MRITNFVTALVALFMMSAPALAAAAGNLTLTLGGDRPATLLMPASTPAGQQVPLVVFLHGYTGEAATAAAFFQVSSQYDQLGVALLLPQGTTNGRGERFWNAAPECCDFDRSGVDDSAYLAGLITEALRSAPIDPRRVYVMGHSNGGFMSYRLACDHPDLVRGVVSIAGAFFKDPLLCWETGPVHILQIHGTADETIPYLGNDTFTAATDSVRYWSMQASCTGMERREAVLDLVPPGPGSLAGERTSETSTVTWTGCDNEVRIGLWSLDGAVHSPVLRPSWLEAALEFVR